MLHDTYHQCIRNGGTIEDAYNDTLLLVEAKLTLTNKGLHDFSKMPLALPPAEMLRVNPQLVAKLDYDKDVFHGYVDLNLPRLNICQETTINVVFNIIVEAKGTIFFLDDLGGSGKTFVHNMLLALV
jgi:hypothetical protein